MSNEDFWKSIGGIIDGGFTPEGLKTLESYAEQFATGRILYKRFSPTEQRGCAKGGQAHVIASLLAGAKIGPDILAGASGRDESQSQCAQEQARRIEAWAKKAGCWVDNADEALARRCGEKIAAGGEAVVYDNGPTLIKAIGLRYFILPELALDRISLHNTWFPETRLEVKGFGRKANGDFVVIAEQIHIQGSHMTEEEIRSFAEAMGFELISKRSKTYSIPGTYLSDLHDENVIKDSDGYVYVIDCDIRINTPELRARGTRGLTNEVAFAWR